MHICTSYSKTSDPCGATRRRFVIKNIPLLQKVRNHFPERIFSQTGKCILERNGKCHFPQSGGLPGKILYDTRQPTSIWACPLSHFILLASPPTPFSSPTQIAALDCISHDRTKIYPRTFCRIENLCDQILASRCSFQISKY